MNERLESALETLWERSRFISYFYQAVQCIEHAAVPTLALSHGESRLILYYNENFIDRTPAKELIGLLVHEMLHVVLNHDHRAGPGGDLYLRNLAQDMVINSFLAERKNSFFSSDRRSGGAPDVILPRGLPLVPVRFVTETGVADPSWEALYRWLKERPASELSEYAPGSSSGIPTHGPETGTPGGDTPDFSSMFSPRAEPGDSTTFTLGDTRGLVFIDRTDTVVPTGAHLFPQFESQALYDAKRQSLFALADNDRECAGERALHEIRGFIERTEKTDVDSWRRQLKSLVDFTAQSNEWTYTYGRFNRRYFTEGIYAPGRAYREQELITVAVDVSASMMSRPGDLQEAFGAVEELLDRYRVHLLCLDEELFVPEKKEGVLAASRSTDRPFVYKKGDWRHIRTGSGGTTFFAPLFNRHMRGHRELLLVITDGYVYDLPRLKKYAPTVWVVVSSRPEPFDPPFGQVVRMRATER